MKYVTVKHQKYDGVAVRFLKYVTDFLRFFEANLDMLRVTYSHPSLKVLLLYKISKIFDNEKQNCKKNVFRKIKTAEKSFIN